MFHKSFRNAMVAVALSLPVVSLTAHNSLADQRDFTVINKTSSPIRHLYVSYTGEDKWGEDILGKDLLAVGESTLIYFTGDDKVCSYDIKAVFEDGEEAEDYKVNLCETETYSFTEN